jgi:hypothetical protein
MSTPRARAESGNWFVRHVKHATSRQRRLNAVVSIVEIQKFLQARDPIALGYEQFALDWIEETLDRIEQILEAEEITTDDETYSGALRYRVENILEIMRPHATCYEFFVDLNNFLRGVSR